MHQWHKGVHDSDAAHAATSVCAARGRSAAGMEGVQEGGKWRTWATNVYSWCAYDGTYRCTVGSVSVSSMHAVGGSMNDNIGTLVYPGAPALGLAAPMQSAPSNDAFDSCACAAGHGPPFVRESCRPPSDHRNPMRCTSEDGETQRNATWETPRLRNFLVQA